MPFLHSKFVNVKCHVRFAGRHCCVLCNLSKQDMQQSLVEREPGVRRTLEQMAEYHDRYIQAGAVKEKAKNVSMNVIGSTLFDIPINQVDILIFISALVNCCFLS